MVFKRISFFSLCFFIAFSFSYQKTFCQDFEREFFTKLVFVEWRLFGKVTEVDYGKKINNIEMKTWGEIFPYYSRFKRIDKILKFYFSDTTHIDYVNGRLKKNTKLKFRLLDNIHSAIDEVGDYEIEVAEDYYYQNALVLPSGLKGILEITKLKKRKGLLNNGKISGRIKSVLTWYGDSIFFEKEYEMKTRPNLNILMGGIGYIVAGFQGSISGLVFPNTQNIYLKKGEEFWVNIEKDIPVWGISWK
ncbi:MAG: hypothetical protein M0Q02_00340 [Candidatus Muirbacterium halophilum]|nr:hypothetical protein [Candidatus Muirbacterium halophilum]